MVFETVSLKWGQVLSIWWFLLIALAISVAAVLIARLGRARQPSDSKSASDDWSIVRPLLGLFLTSGLLIFTAASFALADEQLRSMLIGAVVASSSAVTAFYFSAKAADKAREDLLAANFGPSAVDVPDLAGMTVAEAKAAVNAIPGLDLAFVGPAPAAEDWIVEPLQNPAPGRSAKGTTVTVATRAP